MPQLTERPKLLSPVAGNTAANGKNSEPGLPQQRGRKMLQVFERIEAQFVPSG